MEHFAECQERNSGSSIAPQLTPSREPFSTSRSADGVNITRVFVPRRIMLNSLHAKNMQLDIGRRIALSCNN
jgi:hypothetical protein